MLSTFPAYGDTTLVMPFEDSAAFAPARHQVVERQRVSSQPPRKRLCSSDEDGEKENASRDSGREMAEKGTGIAAAGPKAPALMGLGLNAAAAAPRKVGARTVGKAKGRVGLRRL